MERVTPAAPLLGASAAASVSSSAWQEPRLILSHLESLDVGAHPLFRRLRSAPFDPAATWLLFEISHIGARDFVSQLMSIAARVDDARTRAILVKQLNDELGDGNPECMHTVLFDQMMAAITCWKPPRFDDAAIAAAHWLHRGLDEHFCNPDVYRALGASMAGEIFAKKFDALLYELVLKQHDIDPASLRWLTLHVELELDHADDSLALADLIPRRASALASVGQGAQSAWAMFMSYVDRLELACGKTGAAPRSCP